MQLKLIYLVHNHQNLLCDDQLFLKMVNLLNTNNSGLLESLKDQPCNEVNNL